MANKDQELRQVVDPTDIARKGGGEDKHTDCGEEEKLRQGDIDTIATSSVRDSNSEVRDAVGRRVRASYGELIQQPIPDKFLQLLDQLQVSEEAAKRRKS
ncbi:MULTISPECIES: NepR family anti-sigma factor [Filomicrobium]|uniref:Anti-sigma factor NepR domain-containing protein n=2 Tax=Filomicrobium TaxID=119044 RepID=A0A0D6JGB9_9HYPH|nr:MULTISPECIES: NepR family anti-sigma factor [Filomicrobium]MCV0369822.1 hypothetical protein [Filomicrobium sp.]CPR20148.1 protein of unknown function [Candidatus Filomicrobium marinum]SDP10967.1 hypothetical protein SAMN04488061_2210 [Filomicrobium insigne]